MQLLINMQSWETISISVYSTAKMWYGEDKINTEQKQEKHRGCMTLEPSSFPPLPKKNMIFRTVLPRTKTQVIEITPTLNSWRYKLPHIFLSLTLQCKYPVRIPDWEWPRLQSVAQETTRRNSPWWKSAPTQTENLHQPAPHQPKIHTNPSKPVKRPYWVRNQQDIFWLIVPKAKKHVKLCLS